MGEASDRPGRLIVVEGIDGSGKTTVARELLDRLEERGQRPLATQEPTDSFLGTAVREALSDPAHDPVSEALLFAADHASHVSELRSILAEGRTVVSDRWSTSWRVYQSITLQEALGEADPAAWLEAIVEPFELTPDLVLLLDLPVERALERLEDRARRPEKFERAAFLKQVRGRYLELAQTRGFARIDASGPVDETVDACMEHVEGLFEGLFEGGSPA